MRRSNADMPCEDDDEWQELWTLDRCKDCEICIRKCPTGAINYGRFLLYAERCIVLHNEEPSTVPFPRWLDPSWHNCLIGCLLCQRYCPENKNYLKQVVNGPEFSDEETGLLLAGTPKEGLSPGLLKKLESSDLKKSTCHDLN
jgi:epoxyqueuosine reductase